MFQNIVESGVVKYGSIVASSGLERFKLPEPNQSRVAGLTSLLVKGGRRDPWGPHGVVPNVPTSALLTRNKVVVI